MKKLFSFMLIVFCVLSMSACLPELEDGQIYFEGNTSTYEVFEIEGMPCLLVDGFRSFGVTCDWTQWEGNQ